MGFRVRLLTLIVVSGLAVVIGLAVVSGLAPRWGAKRPY
jgi:uncharacterized membrane protein YphA (DoxX/SURF4 family)